MPYDVKDIDLAPSGERSIDWAMRHMPVLANVRERFSDEKLFEGITVGTSLHIESTTAVFLLTLQEGGAELAVTGSNPLSTVDKVAAALADKGINVYAWRGENEEEYYRNIEKTLDHEPDFLIDDGADLISYAHSEKGDILSKIRGGSEETTTGVKRLRAMHKKNALEIPIIAVNDTPAKRLFDNRFGTGESTVNAVMSITNSMIAGKNVIVVGFGPVGQGIAMRTDGLGADVTVIETDPIRALEAAMQGFRVTNMDEASKYGDIFITATGNYKVIGKEHFEKMKDGAILCNSGHFNVEVDLEGLEEISTESREILEDIKEYKLEDGRKLHVLAEGRLVNLAGEKSLGHPAEIMDMSFALQALSLEHMVKNDLPVKVHEVPAEIDRKVAQLKLEAMNIEIEELTKEQMEYEESWKLGT
ncbi:S-adenosyl-L-homocysteine hydrolase [candidate division MSBL1 archaeon SCGC-AAA259J03]|uniref:Adenosylhomocysteinase n=2 Tax=candidate division MSBL1 TaxID=215777 RepID=A0A656YW85_9EURY|nr:S-adenosyl-L-homocysteine hydrolase [candidate division MSBL1 archaeon SCGC-AAA259J03]